MSSKTYKIYDDLTIEMWVEGQPQSEPPVLRQPFNPNTGEAFASYEEAESWIIDYITPKPEVVVEETPVLE